MSLALYFDHHVPRAVAAGLRLRGVDLLIAYEDDAHELKDPLLLDRATALGRVLFSQDYHLLREARRRQRASIPFLGVIYVHQLKISIGDCVNDLELLCKASEPEELVNQVMYLPL